jgi:hypothetical protein
LEIVTGSAGNIDVYGAFIDSSDAAPPVPENPEPFHSLITTATTTVLTTAPTSASKVRVVKGLNIRNRDASATIQVTVQVDCNATGSDVTELHSANLAPGEALEYVEGLGWYVLPAAKPVFGGIGTPATAAQSLTASSANVVTGTLVQLPTTNLKVGSRFRFMFGLDKTAAGTATWKAELKWGTAGTTGDAAVATWTSGTNTAAIDEATLVIEAVVATLGASGTWQCIAFYVNTLTNATGLGKISFIPTPTASFNSDAANPYIHVDITPGASAVMTSVASAERLA